MNPPRPSRSSRFPYSRHEIGTADSTVPRRPPSGRGIGTRPEATTKGWWLSATTPILTGVSWWKQGPILPENKYGLSASQRKGRVDSLVCLPLFPCATRANLEFRRPDILGTRSLDMKPRRAGPIPPAPFSCSEDYNSPKRGTHPFAERRHPMAQKTFLLIASIIFSLIALGHLSRLVFKWSALLGPRQVPL